MLAGLKSMSIFPKPFICTGPLGAQALRGALPEHHTMWSLTSLQVAQYWPQDIYLEGNNMYRRQGLRMANDFRMSA